MHLVLPYPIWRQIKMPPKWLLAPGPFRGTLDGFLVENIFIVGHLPSVEFLKGGSLAELQEESIDTG